MNNICVYHVSVLQCMMKRRWANKASKIPKVWRIINGRINILMYMYFTFLSKIHSQFCYWAFVLFFFIHVLNVNLGIPVLLSVFYKIACCYICFMYISKQLNFAQDSDKFALLCYSLLACTWHTTMFTELWVRPLPRQKLK